MPNTTIERSFSLLVNREMAAGLEHMRALGRTLETSTPAYVDYLAQWVDAGFPALVRLRELLENFPAAQIHALPVGSYLHLCLANGIYRFLVGDYRPGIVFCTNVIDNHQGLDNPALLLVAQFFRGRSFQKLGDYCQALSDVTQARTAAEALQFPKMAAVIAIAEGGLRIRLGETEKALTLLKSAEACLTPPQSDDHVRVGNIHSWYARIARRSGKYQRAIQAGERGGECFKNGHTLHRYCGRSLVELAFGKTLLAREINRSLQLGAEEHRAQKDFAEWLDKVRALAVTTGDEELRRLFGMRDVAKFARVYFETVKEPELLSARMVDRNEKEKEVQTLVGEARAHLAAARDIFEAAESPHGLGSVCLVEATLALVEADEEQAERYAAEAYGLAVQDGRHDIVLMIKARIIQAKIHLRRAEELIGIDCEYEAGAYRDLAHSLAEEAAGLAKGTDNDKLQAWALIVLGLCCSFGSKSDRSEAVRHFLTARRTLRPEIRDFVWDDLRTLGARVLDSTPIQEVVRRQIGEATADGRSLDELVEEYKTAIISVVYKAMRRVDIVAKLLKVSPNTVKSVVKLLPTYSDER